LATQTYLLIVLEMSASFVREALELFNDELKAEGVHVNLTVLMRC